MRLYLSSYGLGNHPEHLLSLVGTFRRAVVIGNAIDFRDLKERKESMEGTFQALQQIGFKVTELDLRQFFYRPQRLEKEFENVSLIWVRGGNSFLLRRAMKQSGFDECLKRLLKKDRVVYGGYSAGAVVVGDSLRGIELVDDPHQISEGYQQEVIWDGIGLLDFSIAPHYQSSHPESQAVDQVIDYYRNHNRTFKALRDGEALIVQSKKVCIV